LRGDKASIYSYRPDQGEVLTQGELLVVGLIQKEGPTWSLGEGGDRKNFLDLEISHGRRGEKRQA